MAIAATLGSPMLSHQGDDTWTVSVPVTYTSGAVSIEEFVSATVNAGREGAADEFARILKEQVGARMVVLERQIVLTPIAAAIVADVQATLDGD